MDLKSIKYSIKVNYFKSGPSKVTAGRFPLHGKIFKKVIFSLIFFIGWEGGERARGRPGGRREEKRERIIFPNFPSFLYFFTFLLFFLPFPQSLFSLGEHQPPSSPFSPLHLHLLHLLLVGRRRKEHSKKCTSRGFGILGDSLRLRLLCCKGVTWGSFVSRCFRILWDSLALLRVARGCQ